MRRSRSNCVAPYPIRQSRSISPRRSPPSRERPSVGWRVKTARGPLIGRGLSAQRIKVKAEYQLCTRMHLVHNHVLYKQSVYHEFRMNTFAHLVSKWTHHYRGRGIKSQDGTHLVIDWAKVNIRFHRFASDTTGKHIFPRITETVFDKDTRHIFNLGNS